MTAFVRRQSILELLRKQPGLRVPELAAELGVSQGTIRNDLNALEADGELKRVRGGAVVAWANDFNRTSFSSRHKEHSSEKMGIASSAAKLVRDGDSIFLDASSTVYDLGLIIQDRQRLRVVTNGLDVARLLAQNPANSVILIGGLLNPDGSSVTGLLSEQIIHDLHIQKAFVSSSGFSLERGMTEVDLAEAQLKRKAIESSALVIALIDSSKFGKEDLTPFARVNQISCMFSDDRLTPEWVEQLTKAGIDLTVCKEEAAGK